MEAKITIEKDRPMPTSSRGGNGATFINVFSSEIKPMLEKLKVGQNLYIPSANPKKDKRDYTWLVNKYGQKHGRKYLTEMDTAGVRIYLAANGLAKVEPKITENYKAVIGNHLELPTEATGKKAAVTA